VKLKPIYKYGFLFLAVFAALAVLETSKARAGDREFTLVNDTGVEIHHVWIAPHDSGEWGEDILDEDTLAAGGSVHIRLSRKEKAALWNLKVDNREGTPLHWENLNLPKISKVTLHFRNGKGTASIE
jgi:hypothetical protein